MAELPVDDTLASETARMAVEGSSGNPEPAVAGEARSSLRVLIVALNYAPEMVGCAKYTTELAEALVADGHQVEVVCGPPYYPKWRIQEGYSGATWRREELNGVKLSRTPLFVPKKVSGLSRILHLASFGAATFPAAIATAIRFRPDLVFTVAPSLSSSVSAAVAARLVGARSWLHIQDFEVDAAFDLGLLRSRRGRSLALAAERTIFKAFDRVSTISAAMMNLLIRKGVPREAIVELRNWVDVDKTPRLPSSNTAYRVELGIGTSDVVALYSGNMAAKQGIEMLADVAREAAARNDAVRFIFCGEGPARSQLEEGCRGVSNVSFLPLQPLERLPELLGTADIHLLPQRPEAADLVLPSKLTGMLASGRPVVAMAEAGSGLAEEVAGCGLAVPPSAAAMVDAVLKLAVSPKERLAYGDAARLKAEERWRKTAIIGAFERTAVELVKEKRTRGG